MSKADEMFEELGYKLDVRHYNCDNSFVYTYKKDNDFIRFNTAYTTVCTLFKTSFNQKELQAINEKCKELGWLDE